MQQHHGGHTTDGRAKSPRRVSEPGRRSLSPSSEELRHHQQQPGLRDHHHRDHLLHHQQLTTYASASLAGIPLSGGGPRSLPSGVSRSATATPTGSPKRRHLPQIPSALQQTSFARVRQDVEERARMLKLRMGQTSSSSASVSGGGGSGGVRSWRMYSGHSDNDLPPQRSSGTCGGTWGGGHHSQQQQHHQQQQPIYSVGSSRSGAGGGIGRTGRSLSGAASDGGGGGKNLHSPDRDRVNTGGGGGDSDVESLVSFVSGTSALSTQSERPAASYVKRPGWGFLLSFFFFLLFDAWHQGLGCELIRPWHALEGVETF